MKRTVLLPDRSRGDRVSHTFVRSRLEPRLRLEVRWKSNGRRRAKRVGADWQWSNNGVVIRVEAEAAGPVCFDRRPGLLVLQLDCVLAEDALLAAFALQPLCPLAAALGGVCDNLRAGQETRVARRLAATGFALEWVRD